MHGKGYTLEVMAARCGMMAHTLSYYERVELIGAVERERNGHIDKSEAGEKEVHLSASHPGLGEAYTRHEASRSH